MENLDPEIVATFLDEVSGFLETINEGLLAMEADLKNGVTQKTGVDSLFRAFHSIKGGSGMLGFGRINRLTHKGENLLEAIRSEKVKVSRSCLDVLFKTADGMNVLLEELRSGVEDTGYDLEAAIAGLERVLSHAGEAAVHSAPLGNGQVPGAASGPVERVKPDMMKYLQTFLDESTEALELMDESLLKLEDALGAGTTGDLEPVHELFRQAHKFKASSGAMGLMALSKLTHSLETVLDRLRTQQLTLSKDVAAALLRATQIIRQAMEEVRVSQATGHTGTAERLALEALLGTPAPQESLVAADPTPAPSAGVRSVRVLAGFGSGTPVQGMRAFLICSRLKENGEMVKSVPVAEQLARLDTLTEFEVEYRGLLSESEIRKVFHTNEATIKQYSEGAEPGVTPQAKPAVSAAPSGAGAEKAAKPAGNANAHQTMRVDVERLDRLMNMSGELVVSKARFVGIASEVREALDQTDLITRLGSLHNLVRSFNSDGIFTRPENSALRTRAEKIASECETVQQLASEKERAKAVLLNLDEAVHELDQVSGNIQKAVMDIRMVPIGPLFGKFKRVVRDICSEQAKEVQLVLMGEDTELDKKIIDDLGDPLTHLVRNAVDHGIEGPDERGANGKSTTGTVTLNAFSQGTRICLTISDDGKGIDCEAIRRKAVEKGIYDAAAAEALSSKELIHLIFHPGFSTAAKVTNISGRGVGMDIVKRKIEELGGQIEISTTKGKGSVFTLSLPLTLATQTALLCEMSGVTFAVPLANVVEIVEVPREQVIRIHGDTFISIRGRVLPLKEARELFRGRAFDRVSTDAQTLRAVVVCEGDNHLALVVDRLIGEEEIVVKSLGLSLGEIPGVAGVSILGSGAVALIIDTQAVLRQKATPGEGERHASASV